MNLKALITTLVLGSSTMASADSVTFTGSVSVSLGGSTARPAPLPAPAPVIVRDHRTVAQDPCATPAPAPVVVYQPPAPTPVIVHHQPQPLPPVWSGPFYDPHNTRLGGDSSSYTGTWGQSTIKFRPATWHGYSYNERRTQNWFEMTEATRIDNGRLFMHPRDNGYYRALKIQALGNGSSNIVQVRIDFKDKHTGMKGFQIVKLNQQINRYNPSLTIDLDGNYRQINRIIVYGQTDRGSAIKLLAM